MKRELNCINFSSWVYHSKVLHVVHIVSQGFSHATVNGDLVVMRTQACIYSNALMLLLNTPELVDAIPCCGCLHCAGLQSGPAVDLCAVIYHDGLFLLQVGRACRHGLSRQTMILKVCPKNARSWLPLACGGVNVVSDSCRHDGSNLSSPTVARTDLELAAALARSLTDTANLPLLPARGNIQANDAAA